MSGVEKGVEVHDVADLEVQPVVVALNMEDKYAPVLAITQRIVYTYHPAAQAQHLRFIPICN